MIWLLAGFIALAALLVGCVGFDEQPRADEP